MLGGFLEDGPELFKVLICGGRQYEDVRPVWERLRELRDEHEFVLVIHGDCRGADRLGGMCARALRIHEVKVPALWQEMGRQAGRIRNEAMLKLRPDLVLAYPGGNGTAHMCSIAEKAGIPVERYDDRPAENSIRMEGE